MKKLNTVEVQALHAFKCFGKFQFTFTSEGVSELLAANKEMGCWMSLKMHFLHLHLEFFSENLGAIIAKQAKIYHQDIQAMDKKYQGV